MHLVMISCTPRAIKASNTAKILEKFKEGYESFGNTTETFYLADKKSWDQIRMSYYENSDILFALPLFVECIPGIMMEFLESLDYDRIFDIPKKKVAFLVQGGFAEASQLRCCEKYLKMLPAYLNAEHRGTLIKGDMFGVSIMQGNTREKMIAPFVEMGRLFAKEGHFDEAKVSEFAKPEYFSKGVIAISTIFSPVQKLMMQGMAKKLGCKGSLNAKPYQRYVSD
ncbi:MAG: hypothetical protein E7256_11840 [Lachnospiraceae bacterium]|nr:hypothetical protein [Lachnospiraceae bacterium]